MSEKHYEFREWMKKYHLRDGRKRGRSAQPRETEISNHWMIYAEEPADDLVERAVSDLKHFLRDAMGGVSSPESGKKIYLKVPGGRTKANIALARKFLEIIYRILKNHWIFEDFTQFKLKTA